VVARLGVDGTGPRPVHVGADVAWVSPDELVVGLCCSDADVYTMGIDGAHPRLVVTGASSLGGLAVSPDRTQLAFTAGYGTFDEYGSTLYVADLRGLDRDVRRVSPDICSVRGWPDTDGADRLRRHEAGGSDPCRRRRRRRPRRRRLLRPGSRRRRRRQGVVS
jgi:hypothetical protein